MTDSADGTENLSVDLLIGADYSYCFVMDHVVRGSMDLVQSPPLPILAMSSKALYQFQLGLVKNNRLA